jgi:hypothetical protein
VMTKPRAGWQTYQLPRAPEEAVPDSEPAISSVAV